MEALFLQLVNMSITASWLVLAIIAVRLIFKKAPKWILCLLWGLVAFRLICPFSIESAMSLIPSAEPLPQEIIYTAEPQIHSGVPVIDNAVNPVLESSMTPAELTSANPTQIWSFILSQVWILGMVLMFAYTLVSYLLLKRKVATAIPLVKGIKQSEYVDSPFVLGIIRPVIYLPFGMEKVDMAYVIAHEKAHIRRRDHWWKPFGFLMLSVYWFNPVLWVAYILLCRDIEAACDEKVIKDMEKDERRAYSTALLNCSIHRRRIAACPLAFGETGVKARVKSVMNYKKPAFWVILIALVVSIVVAVCFLTNPKDVLPVTVDVDYVGRKWADLKFIIDDSYAEDEIQISDDYILEVQEQGIWREVENISGKQPAQQVIDVQSDSADYDAWTSINWEEQYGRLPDGTFRLRKDVTINKDSDNSETQPIYVEFTIGGTADEYVTYTLEDITPTGAKLYEHEKVDNEFKLIYDGSDGIWLESYQDGQWAYVEPTEYIEPLLKKDRHYIHQLIYPSEYIQLDWSALYGELPDGNYRIAREVTNTAEGDLRVCTAYAEFTIDTNWGIELLVDKISENGLSVSILIGDDVADGEYFHVGAALQHKEGIGHWIDIIPLPEEIRSQNELLSDMSAISLMWDSELHKLTEGQYRVGIQIQRVHPSGEKEISVVYEYFDPSEYAWGASIEVTEILQENGPRLTVEHNGTKKMPEGCLTMSHDFRLEKRSNNQWEDMGTPLEDIPDTEHPIAYGNNYETEYIGITHYFGELPDGTYRLVKDVTRYYDDGSTETRPIYAVFSIDKNNPAERDNIYTWFDRNSTDVNERSPKDNVVPLSGMDGVSLSYGSSINEILLVSATENEPIISCDVLVESAFLTDLTRDGIAEVCANVQTMQGSFVQVYDAAEKKLYELPNEANSFYVLTKKADRLCVLKNSMNWITMDYGQLSLNPGQGLAIHELDPEVRELTEKLVCIDIDTHKYTCLSTPSRLENALKLLRDLKESASPASQKEIADAQANTFDLSHISINYELGEKTITFSEDFEYVWEYGSKEGYRVSNPEAISQFVENVTDGVMNRETSGERFATPANPWDWCAGINNDAISTAEIYACLAVTSDGTGSSVSSTNGILPTETLQSLIEIINKIPKEAFSDSGKTEQDYRWFFLDQTEGNCAISMVDGVNQMAVAIRLRNGFVEMLLTDELDKALDSTGAYLNPVAKIWTVRDPALSLFLENIQKNPPLIQYSIGAEYDWQDPMVFQKDGFSVNLRFIEGWEIERVENATNSGVRCRPAEITDGWVYFSYWPEDYTPKEEDRYIHETGNARWTIYVSYPSDVKTATSLMLKGREWSYRRYDFEVGDYVIINDGAGLWFTEYLDEIEDTISLSKFTIG